MARALTRDALKRASLSLGMRSFVAGALVFVAPILYFGVSVAIEDELAHRTELRERQCADAIEAAGPTADLAKVAAQHCDPYRFRVETSDPLKDDRVISDTLGQSGENDRVGDLLYGKERVEYLRDLASRLPPLEKRTEVQAVAWPEGENLTCRLVPEANLRICAYARVRWTDRGVYIVDVIGASRSARLARYADRRELAAMLVFGAIAASALILWLRHLVTGPVHSLARDVDAQARAVSTGGKLDEARPRELAEVARAFNRLRDALARADAQNEAFLADLAHEMKNPVAAIAAAAEALENPPAASKTDARTARTEALLRSISSSASRLDRLVRQFLELARAEAGLATDEREKIDLGDLMRGVAGTMDDPRIALEAPPSGDVPVSCAATRIESAVRNLVDNALVFAKERVSLRVRLEGAEAVLEVEDDGAGIRAEDLPHVFERFFSARGDGRGTGLGLAIVRAVTEAHGGRVDVRSSESGTTFSLRLPLAS